MKKVFFICFIFNAGILLAQTPPAVTATKTAGQVMLPANDIITNIALSKELSTFYKLINITGLNQTFSSKGPITVFASTNQSFAKLSKGKTDTLLMPEHKYDLIALITYHIIAGKISAKDIIHQINTHKGRATLITITGSKLTASLNANHNIVLTDENGGQSTLSQFDIKQSNGLIHIVDSVLIPKFKII